MENKLMSETISSTPTDRPNSLSELVSSLQKAKEAIPNQQELLKNQPKSPENYLIGRNGILIETDQTPTPKKNILKE